MQITFTKMHGLGNDFVVIDATKDRINLSKQQIVRIADRHFGIGCDQVLLIESSLSRQKQGFIPPNKVDFLLRIFNADGSEAEQCGNGARCVAKFVYDNGLTKKREFTIGTVASKLKVRLEPGSDVTVNMGKPVFSPKKIPFVASNQILHYNLQLPMGRVDFGLVSLGNPHAVLKVDNINDIPVGAIGQAISTHSKFPRGVNVGFMEIVNPAYIRLRVYERGSGETLACGSSACAAVVIGRLWKLLKETVIVELHGGKLEVNYKGVDSDMDVLMKGEAVKVFEGKIVLLNALT